jgi:hypothetical protein
MGPLTCGDHAIASVCEPGLQIGPRKNLMYGHSVFAGPFFDWKSLSLRAVTGRGDEDAGRAP